MSNSFANAIPLTCSNCRRNFNVELWLIVDVDERPDLLARARDGNLHDFPCLHCGHDGRVDAPLLIYSPKDAPHLIFSPAEETSEDEDVDQVTFLLDMLRDNVGPLWRDEWVQEVATLPRQLLPATLSDDSEAAMQQLATEMEAELDRLRREDPDAYRELEEAARRAEAQETTPPESPPEMPPAL